MDYEKKYKEALERAKTLYENANGMILKKWVEQVFPELKESEGERIRKRIIHALHGDVLEMSEIKEAVDWLEKQGGQKPVPDWMPKFLDELRSKKNYFDFDEHKDIEGRILAIIKWMSPNYFNEKDGEQKPADNKGMNIDEESMTPFQKKVFCIIDTSIEEEQGLKQVCDELLALASNEIEQKPAWSEVDETVLNNLIYALANDRIGNNRDEYVNWLKSLRLQKQWKPSDEQMEALRWAIYYVPYNKQKEEISGLLEQIKDL